MRVKVQIISDRDIREILLFSCVTKKKISKKKFIKEVERCIFCCIQSPTHTAFSSATYLCGKKCFSAPQKSTRDRGRVSSRARSITRYKDGFVLTCSIFLSNKFIGQNYFSSRKILTL